MELFQTFQMLLHRMAQIIDLQGSHSKECIHHLRDASFTMLASWGKKKIFLGPSASHDIVITQFGNYKS